MKLVLIVLLSFAGSLLALGQVAPDAPPKIYTCKNAEGNVVYQDDPCIEAAKPSAKPKAVAKPKPVVRPKSAPAALPWAAVLPSAPPLTQPSRQNPSVDSKMTSPQRTMQTFVGAVKDGDRAVVLSCLTSSALADLGPDLEDLPLQELRETVGSFTGYVVEGDLGPFWSIRALRAGTRPKWIFLERTGSGEWKIGGF